MEDHYTNIVLLTLALCGAFIIYTIVSKDDPAASNSLDKRINATSSKMGDVGLDELLHLMERAHPQTLVDVRSREELHESGRIPGSVNIPLQTLEDIHRDRWSLEEAIGRPLGQHGENIILTCRSGRRALIAQKLLDSVGLSRTSVYKGGFLEWTAKGQKVEIVTPISVGQ